MIAIDLFLEVFLAIGKMIQGTVHAFHFMLPLKPLAVLAADISGNCVKYALKPVIARNFALFLQFQKIENGMRFDLFKC
jgi:hypothetical protein